MGPKRLTLHHRDRGPIDGRRQTRIPLPAGDRTGPRGPLMQDFHLLEKDLAHQKTAKAHSRKCSTPRDPEPTGPGPRPSLTGTSRSNNERPGSCFVLLPAGKKTEAPALFDRNRGRHGSVAPPGRRRGRGRGVETCVALRYGSITEEGQLGDLGSWQQHGPVCSSWPPNALNSLTYIQSEAARRETKHAVHPNRLAERYVGFSGRSCSPKKLAPSPHPDADRGLPVS